MDISDELDETTEDDELDPLNAPLGDDDEDEVADDGLSLEGEDE